MLRQTRVGAAARQYAAIDLVKKRVRITHAGLPDVFNVCYDQLVLAVGAVTNFYRTPPGARRSGCLDVARQRRFVATATIDALGVADNQIDEAKRKTTLTVVVAGGGFAGIETAGAINDLLRESLRFYRNLKKDMLRVVVVHPVKSYACAKSSALWVEIPAGGRDPLEDPRDGLGPGRGCSHEDRGASGPRASRRRRCWRTCPAPS